MPIEKKEFATFENFNEVLRVIDTRAWIAFTSVFFLIGCCIVWLFFGNIPTKIVGTGMLINVSGIKTINSNVSGKIASLNVKIGDYIKKDQPVASISQWTLNNEIQNQEQKIADQEIANQQTEQIAIAQEEKYKKERDDLNAKLQTLQKMLQIGSASETEVMDAKQRITETEKKIDELNIERIKKRNDLNQLRRTLESLKKQYARESIILSPDNGVVVEISRTTGDLLEAGGDIVTIELSNSQKGGLKGVIYISALESKKVSPGMKVLVSPTIIKPEEYGSIIGTVKSISAYPATVKSIMRILHNEEIVKNILSKGNQVEVNVELESNPKTISQYQWTSKEGPPQIIQSGTLCNAKIIVEKKHPIQFIVPKIKKWANLGNE